jgi:hypothetical protein
MSGLTELLARVEAATGPDREIDKALSVALLGYVPGKSILAPGKHTASIDASRALVVRMLPEGVYSSGRGPNSAKRKRKTDGVKIPFDGFVASDDRIGERTHTFGIAEGPTEAIAVIIALLRALIARTPDTGGKP